MRTHAARLLLLIAATASCAPAARGTRTGGIPEELLAEVVPVTAPITLPPITEKRLANGLTVLVVEDHEVPIVRATLVWPSGDLSDPAERSGRNSLMARTLTQGSRNRTAEQIAEEVDVTGSDLVGWSSNDGTFLSLRTLSKDFPSMLGLFAEIARYPSFPGEEIEERRREAIAMARGRFDDPFAIASAFALPRLYGAGNPLAYLPTEASISRITRDDVVQHARRTLQPDGARLLITGDVTPGLALTLVEPLFESWSGTAAKNPAVPSSPAPERRVLLVDKPGLTQSTLLLGLPGMTRRHPEFRAAYLANDVLGGSFQSRLTRVVRAEGGKTYGISSWLSAGRDAGLFLVSTSTRSEETVATMKLLLAEMEKMRDGGAKPDELRRTKTNLTGGYALGFESPGDVLWALVSARMDGLPDEYVTDWRGSTAAVPLEAVNAAARRWFDTDHALIVVVGDAKVVKKPLEDAFGTVETAHFLDAANPDGRDERR